MKIDKIQAFNDVVMQMHKTYIAKNRDYGDSYSVLRKELGVDAILYRVGDKYNRLKTLLRGKTTIDVAKVTEESIEDTLLDMANYCVMELVERQADKEARVDSCIGKAVEVPSISLGGFLKGSIPPSTYTENKGVNGSGGSLLNKLTCKSSVAKNNGAPCGLSEDEINVVLSNLREELESATDVSSVKVQINRK